ncbi:DUF6492 family protein [Piscinibacter sp.]|jgi:hypothetical protein|uniref:DUF6492 family protein n=1 Tax=Piscinibacter sp. TaxID=1903157 RepID=UPI003559823A
MADFALVCKSYRGDAVRVKRLLDSLAPHNPQGLPVVVAVPQDDLALFRDVLSAHRPELVSDEDIVRSHPEAAAKGLLERYRATPGYRSQQVIKADAWRLLGCSSYLCVDSDTVFLRDIGRDDFLHPAGHPYTLLHQSRELLQLAVNRGHADVARHFHAESQRIKALFGRVGPDYDFGPQPLLWSARVWADLHERFLAPRGWTLWDAIEHAPTEIRWYGEALLAYRSIPIDPIEPLFRVYHHEWQWFALRRLGETPDKLAEQFLGAVYQSNWEFELDAIGRRSAMSRLGRRLKRWRRRLEALW